MATKKNSKKGAIKKTTKKVAKPSKKSVKKTVSKKIVKKTAPKKPVSRKKSIPKKAVKKITRPSKPNKQNLVHAPYEHVFWVCDGMVLKNLRDLANALEHMTDESYKHHANSKRNDFSAWVRDILQEPRLAKALEDAKSRKEALKKIKTKLQRLK